MPSVNVAHAWKTVLSRDRRGDGRFVYAVSSTHVYCRPSCPSRRPTRNHVTFFDSQQLAESAGYRACLRCRPQSSAGSEVDERIERAREYLDDHADESITLRRLAIHVGLSPFHLQRTFTNRVGLSPKAYQSVKRIKRFTTSLKRGETVTHATYEAGFGSSSRLYARVHEDLGMTPSAFRSGGMGVTLCYTTVPTVVGRMLVAVTERGIAVVSLGETEAALVTSLHNDYPNAVLRRDRKGLAKLIARLLQCLNGRAAVGRLRLDVKATAFQRKV
jgi:AraC family transcriptional regulator, regulatory protein of adaptative response / methylated-DNA-[protein]-cysteine methyltransferase